MKRHCFIFALLLMAISGGLWGQSTVWNEPFDSNNGWTLGQNWTIDDGRLRLYYDPTITDYDISAISPIIQLPANASQLTVNQFFSDYSIDSGEILEIILVSNNQDHILWTWNTDSNNSWPDENNNPADISFSILPYAGQSVQIKLRSHGGSTWNINNWDIYNIKILASYQNDLATLNLSGNTIITEDLSSTFNLQVFNAGLISQSNYSVELYNANNQLLSSAPGITVAAGDTVIVPISWTPPSPGQAILFAKIVLASDELLTNNISDSLTITILQTGTVSVYAGDPNSIDYTNAIPLNFYFKNSLSQTLYYPDELTAQGLLTTLRYYMSLVGDIPAQRPFKIWMANTQQASFSEENSWIPMDQFTLVYDGTVTFDLTGLYEWDIALQQPFVYDGSNLCIMMQRPMDNEFYNSQNAFKVSQTPNHLERSFLFASDSTPINLPTYPDGYSSNQLPNVAMFFNTNGLGTISGNVNNISNSLPIDSVKISIINTPRKTYTNLQGLYSLAYLVPDTVNVTAEKIGFYSSTTNDVIISPEQTSTVNFSLSPIPTSSVSGHISGSDAPNGIQGITVKLSGYTEFITITDASGNFSFPVVYQGYTYNLECSDDNYIAYNTTVAVNNSNISLPNILMTRVYFSYVGNQQSETYYNYLPFDFFYKNSYSQSIYSAQEMNIGGLLTKLQYRMDNYGDIPPNTPLKIWIGETELTSFDNESSWIPLQQMQLCFDSTFTFSTLGNSIVELNLQNPFAYGGGNLVVATYRPMDTNYYNSENTFQVTEDETHPVSTIFFYSDTVPANPESPNAGNITHVFPNAKFYFNIAGMGSISGTILDSQTNLPLTNAKVKINNSYRTAYTNNQGVYTLNYLVPGNYSLTVTKHGYYDNTSVAITVSADQQSACSLNLTPLPMVSVTGRVLGSDNQSGLSGASIKLSGYETYQNIITNDQGYFTINNVFASQTYNMRIYCPYYQPYISTAVVNSTNTNLGTITLNELNNPPRNVLATVSGNGSVHLTWDKPSTSPEMEFRYDDGNIVSEVGLSWVDQSSVFGAVHKRQGSINQIHWYLSSNTNTHSNVNLFIYGLNNNDQPNVNNLIYSVTGVSNIDNEWNQFVLPESVEVNNGFFVGISSEGYLGLGLDDGVGAPYEFVPNTQYYCYSNATNNWVSLESNDLNANLAIRAVGIDFGPLPRVTSLSVLTVDPKSFMAQKNKKVNVLIKKRLPNPSLINYSALPVNSPSRSLTGYSVYLLHEINEGAPNLWTLLSNLTAADSSWFTNVLGMGSGVFEFAVQAKYTNNVFSNAAFSNSFEINMTAEVNLLVNNTNGNPLSYATVRLTNNDNDSTHIYNAAYTGTMLTIPNVRRGSYTIEAFSAGYHDYLAENISITESPFNYTINMLAADNVFFESFENMTSFTTNFPGWVMSDIDQTSTVGFNGITFPNMGSQMAFMAFTPSETTPPLNFQAYDGNKMAACFSSATTANNDFMVTPQISLGTNMLLTFYARSYSSEYALERFRVGIAHNQNLSDMTLLTPTPYVTAPAEWQQYSYALSNYSNTDAYIAFNCVSNDGFIFLVDKIKVGLPSQGDIIPLPSVTKLKHNYPNPFNPETNIAFDLAKSSKVSVEIYNIKGQKVKTLINEFRQPGNYTLTWKGKDDNDKSVASGIYFCRFKTKDYSSTRKMLMLK